MKTIGERIIFLRENLELTQVKLADLLGISKMTLHKYEKNICEPRGELIAKMADVLNTTADYLLGRTSDCAPLTKDESYEAAMSKETNFMYSYRHLNVINKAKIDERIQILLEQQ